MHFTVLLRWVNLHSTPLNSTLDYNGTDTCDFSSLCTLSIQIFSDCCVWQKPRTKFGYTLCWWSHFDIQI